MGLLDNFGPDNAIMLGASILGNNGTQPYQTVGGILGNAFSQYAQTMAQQQLLQQQQQYREMQMQKMQQEMQQRKMIQDAAGYQRYVDTGERVFPDAQKPKDDTTKQRDYQFYVEQETQAGRKPLSFANWDMMGAKASAPQINMPGSDPMQQMPKISELKLFRNAQGEMPTTLMTYQQLNDDGFRLAKDPTEADKKAKYVADSLSTATNAVENVLSNPEFDPTSWTNEFGSISNYFASPEYQQYMASADEWATNLVFLRSGATARQEEKDAAIKNYWPQMGDDDSTVKMKEMLRTEQEINAFKQAALGGWVARSEAEPEIAKREAKLAKLKAGNTPVVKNDSDYDALPSGAIFIDPMGQERRKP